MAVRRVASTSRLLVTEVKIGSVAGGLMMVMRLTKLPTRNAVKLSSTMGSVCLPKGYRKALSGPGRCLASLDATVLRRRLIVKRPARRKAVAGRDGGVKDRGRAPAFVPGRVPQPSRALTMSSTTFLASPNTIMVLGM